MLRVRPILFTSKAAEFTAMFAALGLELSTDEDGWQVFDAGSGRIALHSAEAGIRGANRLELGFEVGDLEEFARRTQADGTPAEVVNDPDHGRSVRITAPGGLSLFAERYEREQHAPDADPALSVLAIWYSASTGPPERMLADIGARRRISSDAGVWSDFTAKNGGLIAVHSADRQAFELAFEYDGDVEVLERRLRKAGQACTLIDESYGRSLRLPNPHGGEIWINERQRDHYGYTVHG